MRRTFVLLAAAGAIFLSQCSNDDGPKSASGIAGGKALLELSAEEVHQLCVFERDSYHRSLTSERAYCVRDTEPAFCEEDLPNCLGSGDYDAELANDWDCDTIELRDYLEGDECSATVAEFEACIREADGLMAKLFRDATCENLADIEDQESQTELTACDKLFDKCPDIDL